MPPQGHVKVPFLRLLQFVRYEGDCWIWTGEIGDGGYGRFSMHVGGIRKKGQAHRFAYELTVGPVPESLELDHLCRIRACVNPLHLEAVTPGENVRRSWNGRRSIRQAPSNPRPHCPQGHAFDELNTYVTAKGHRRCRVCSAAASRRYRERMAAS